MVGKLVILVISLSIRVLMCKREPFAWPIRIPVQTAKGSFLLFFSEP